MMKNPPHPGQSFFVACLEPHDLSVSEGAKVLMVARQTLSKLVNGKAGISPEMAIRIAKAFGGALPMAGMRCKPPMIWRKPTKKPIKLR